jgi:hypothetical protein
VDDWEKVVHGLGPVITNRVKDVINTPYTENKQTQKKRKSAKTKQKQTINSIPSLHLGIISNMRVTFIWAGAKRTVLVVAALDERFRKNNDARVPYQSLLRRGLQHRSDKNIYTTKTSPSTAKAPTPTDTLRQAVKSSWLSPLKKSTS